MVRCRKQGCERVWERDPVLEVPCPTCRAAAGNPCSALRPSGHRVSIHFAPLPGGCHGERDIEALRQNRYGICPSGRCCSSFEGYERRQAARAGHDSKSNHPTHGQLDWTELQPAGA